ncbi:OmpW/AlkL family protein [Roseomonas marmotae]|uniref:OmpW family protein n=1 Tax=Roseomonas marmotae TaxID=2768161 RepID=A0ABS3K8M0_9PROT|nr:OmpW family outer membrane protein [Roseomonas marmotae]MBO1073785.1 OmpW family protein [Roseomonas marmotae]QTI78585.1 OmpW family protein [Roseomonas marmotae]
MTPEVRVVREIPRVLSVALAICGFSWQALAQEVPAEAAEGEHFFLRLGYGLLQYETSGRASVHGARIDDAKIAFGGQSAVLLEAGWRFAPSWSVSVLSGLPPTVALEGRNAFESFGTVSKVTYGSVMLGMQYHPLQFSRFDPYVGAGIDYTAIFNTSGGSLPGLHVRNAYGPVLQAGFEYGLTRNLALYADARKVWLKFRAKGMVPHPVAPYPVQVSVTPNPVVLSVGLTYRF